MLSATITTLATFPASVCSEAGLDVDSAGNLYGTTVNGGASGDGSLFKIAAGSNAFSTLVQFNGTNGYEPEGTLVADTAGNLYGTTCVGGVNNDGNVFEFSPGNDTLTNLVSFNGTNGWYPECGLIADAAGNLYGTTYQGGNLTLNSAHGDGTVFEISAATHTLTTLVVFNGTNGQFPTAGLVADSAGNFYGATSYGGTNNDGTVFEFSTGNGTLSTLASFNGTNGERANSSLIMDTAGDLYGTTASGGYGIPSEGEGVVFELVRSTQTLADLAAFNGSNDAAAGAAPCGVIADYAGNFYVALANEMAPSYDGALDKIAGGTDALSTLIAFNGTNGWHPDSGLVADLAGNLYGTAGANTTTATVFEVSGAGFVVPAITLTGPASQAANLNQSQSLNLGNFTETNDTGPYSVDVNWGDSTTDGNISVASAGTIAATAHTYTANGNYTVTVTVSDATGHKSNSATFTADVANIALTAAATQFATTGQSQTFNLGSFTQSNATGPFTATVNWGDNTNSEFVVPTNTITATAHTYAASGNETVTVTVTDAAGHTSNSATFTVDVASLTATAAATQFANTGVSQAFNLGSFAQSNATGPFTVAVNWGDGGNSSISVAAAGTITPTAHTYTGSGNDTVTVSVADSANHTSNSTTFIVDAAAITATAAATQFANTGQSRTFNLGSFTQANATGPFIATVNWGDGGNNSLVVTAGTITPTAHTYTANGNETVMVTVTDMASHTSNIASFTVDVASITATAAATQFANTGVSQTFNLGSFTQFNATGPFTAAVNWGDGGNSSNSVAAAGTITPTAHTYTASGNETVTVTVTDAANHIANSTTFIVDVASITTTAAATQFANSGQSQAFNLGSFTQANATGPFTALVTWGDGGSSSLTVAPGTITPTAYTYTVTGNETVTVTVSDAANHTSNSATFIVDVASITTAAATRQFANTGVSQAFNLGSFTQANATGPFTAAVNWGDGGNSSFTVTAGTITPTAHTYTASGNETVMVTVTDSASHTSNTATFTVDVASIAVTAAATQFANTGQSQSFNLGSFTQANATGPFVAAVNWGDGGSISFDVAAGTITPTAHTYTASGNQTVTVTVTDAANHTSNSATFIVDVASIVTTAASPQFANTGVSELFNLGSFTQANASGPFTATVNWGDGGNSSFTVTTGTITPTSHTYTASGNEMVTVMVTDSAGRISNSATFIVDVAGITVTAPPNQTVNSGQSQSFNLGSFTQSNASGPFSAWVNWGDGSNSSASYFTGSGVITIPAMIHTYSGNTNDTVTVIVTDALGHSSNNATFIVVVGSIALTAPATQFANTGQSQSFNLGSFTQSGATGPFTAAVNWGDGSGNSSVGNITGTGNIIIPATAHTFAASGNQTVTVSVTDSVGHTSNSVIFVVDVAAIVVTAPATQFVNTGQSQSFNLGSFTQTNGNGPFTATVNWNDGTASDVFLVGVGPLPAQAHTFAASGNQTVSITINDAAGHTSNSVTFIVDAASITLTAPAAQSANIGQSTSFNLGNFTTANGSAPFTATVNWGDGSDNSSVPVATAGIIPATAHTYAANASETVTVTLTDAVGHASNSITFNILVGSIAVTAPATQYANTGQSQSFSLGSFAQSGTDAPFTATVTWGDGSANSIIGNLAAAGAIPATAHTYTTSGNQTVSVSVSDFDDDHTSNTATFTIDVAAITVTAPATQFANTGQSQSFNLGSFVQSNATGPFTATVNWGDGTGNSTIGNLTGTGNITLPTTAHTYTSSGNQTVTVTVTDSASHTSNNATLIIDAAALAVSVPATQAAYPGQNQAFNLGSFTQTNGTGPFTATVDWGDGSNDSTITGLAVGAIPQKTHAYVGTGNDTVTITVTDAANHTSNSATFIVDVATLAVTPPAAQTANAGQSQSFNLGSFTQTNATGPFSILVNWGDGTGNSSISAAAAGVIPAVAHSYANSGNQTVSLTVSDSAGHTSSSTTFPVSVAALTLTPPGSQTTTAGQSHLFALGSFTQANATGPFSVTVNWGDGTANTIIGNLATAETIPATAHTYTSAGNDTVSETVTDSANHTSNLATFGVTVATALSPNLTPDQPAGWSDRIVVTNQSGATTESSPLHTTDDLYVDWAVTNAGTAATAVAFNTTLSVDGNVVGNWSTPAPFAVGAVEPVTGYSIAGLAAGNHTLQIDVNDTGTVVESNTADNIYTKTITVLPVVPTITAISPVSGPAAGGTTVIITGTGFSDAAGVFARVTAVDFGNVTAGSFTINSPTQITATSPAEAAGLVNVTVTGPGGTSATAAADQFTLISSAQQPVYRLYSPVTLEHFYTSDVTEYDYLKTLIGTWNDEGIAYYDFNATTTVNGIADEPLYRLYDSGDKQHFWTTNYNEYNTLRQAPWNWNDEGIAGYVLASAVPSSTPMYRLMAPQVHLWTTDLNEYDSLASDGWTQEGVIGYVM